MRLVTKYEINGVRDAILRRIRRDWPITLEEYDRQQRAWGVSDSPSNPGFWEARQKFSGFLDPASSVSFALEFGCREILPAALWRLVLTDPRKDWDTLQNFTSYRARWHLLDSKVLMRVWTAKSDLRGKLTTSYWIHTFVTSQEISTGTYSCPGPNPKRADPCRKKAFIAFIGNAFTSCGSDDGTLNYLTILSVLHKAGLKEESGLCSRCRAVVAKALMDERQRFWDELGTLFKLSTL